MILTGFKEISIDKSKSLVTVKGGMDMKLLTAALEGRFNTKVEVVQPKDSSNGGGEKKGKGSGGDDKERKESGGDGQRADESKIDYFVSQGQHYFVSQGQPSYPHYVNGPQYPFNYMYDTQMFNDENPNACVVM